MVSYSNSCNSTTIPPSGSPTPDMTVSSYTFETFCKIIDFGGFDTYKRERISGLQNVKCQRFYSRRWSCQGIGCGRVDDRCRGELSAPVTRRVKKCHHKANEHQQKQTAGTSPRRVRKSNAEKGRRQTWKKNKNVHYRIAKKKKSQIISARVQSAGMASKFNGSIMCRRVTECEAEAVCECAALSGESKSGIGWWIVKRSVSGGSYLEKSEGLAGVFLRNVDKEFPQQTKQNSWQGFLRRVDMIINVRQRGT